MPNEMIDPIAEAVAAERRRAAEAVREIVEQLRADAVHASQQGDDSRSIRSAWQMNGAQLCLAAVEGKR